MSLRSRLLAGAAGIVVISLLLSGALTWVLVRNVAVDDSRRALAQALPGTRSQLVLQECANPDAGICDQAVDASTYESRLNGIAGKLGGDRLLLVDPFGTIVYDSFGSVAGQQLSVLPRIQRQQARNGDLRLGGDAYVAAEAGLPAGNPLGASQMILGRSQSAVTATAVSELLPRLLLAGAIALALALVLALLLSRTLINPLTEVVAASDDIAHGNYSRRVAISGSNEIGVLGSAFNRMAEAVERARAAQRDFVANVSHELKTPLTSLIGFSQALVDGSLRTPEEKERAAVVLHEESERMLRLAQELLDLARVEGRQIPLQIQDVDLGSLIRQEVEIARNRAEERQLKLEVELPAALPPVHADPERVHQIFDNLLDNALKYAPQGADVRIFAAAEDGVVRTAVSNPIGDHRPDPERIFERFYRADPSRASAEGGVGLGLAISRELAHAQQGRLWADLDGGDRLRVWLTLPRAVSSPA